MKDQGKMMDPGNDKEPGREKVPGRKKEPGKDKEAGQKKESGKDKEAGRKKEPGKDIEPGRTKNPGHEKEPDRKKDPGNDREPDYKQGQPEKKVTGVEAYFKKELSDVVFIQLKESFFQGEKRENLQFLKGIPIPVSLSRISRDAKDNTISPEAAMEAMAYVLGADATFPYREAYLRFFEVSAENPYFLMLDLGMKQAQKEEYCLAAILFRAAEQYDCWKRDKTPLAPLSVDPRGQKLPDALFNYARACRDVYSESEDTAEKNAFREESVRVFENLTVDFPAFEQSYYFLGYFYMNRKAYRKAKEVWERFLELSSDDILKEDISARMIQLEDLMIYEKGYLEVLNERCESGLEILLPLYEKYKQWWNLLFFLGLAYRKLGRSQEAIPFFLEVARLKPSQADALNELGLCYAAQEDFLNAEKYFKKAALVQDDDPEILCNLAAVYIYENRLSEAETALCKAEEINPNEEITRQWREILEEKKSAEREENHGK